MLANEELFRTVEEVLKENGVISGFENEHGPIRGRMMITETEIPDDPEIKKDNMTAFLGTFDFYDMGIGIAIDTHTPENIGGIWLVPENGEAEEPAEEWVEFFIKTLVENISPDGAYGVPMYTFISDEGDFTVVPTLE